MPGLDQSYMDAMWKRVVVGALAGAAGGIAMKAVVRFVDPESFGLSARTDAESAHVTGRALGWPALTERRAERIGAAMHYGFAIGTGALYGAGERRFPAIRRGRGMAFGTALWLVGDELAVTVSGLEDPRGVAIRSHVSALAAHLVYGWVVDSVVSIGGRLP